MHLVHWTIHICFFLSPMALVSHNQNLISVSFCLPRQFIQLCKGIWLWEEVLYTPSIIWLVTIMELKKELKMAIKIIWGLEHLPYKERVNIFKTIATQKKERDTTEGIKLCANCAHSWTFSQLSTPWSPPVWTIVMWSKWEWGLEEYLDSSFGSEWSRPNSFAQA